MLIRLDFGSMLIIWIPKCTLQFIHLLNRLLNKWSSPFTQTEVSFRYANVALLFWIVFTLQAGLSCHHGNSPAWCGRGELSVPGRAWCPSNPHHPLVRRQWRVQTIHINSSCRGWRRREWKIPPSLSRGYFWQPTQKLARKRNAGGKCVCLCGSDAARSFDRKEDAQWNRKHDYLVKSKRAKMHRKCVASLLCFSSSLHLALMSGFAAAWALPLSLSHTHIHRGCGRPMLRTLWPHLNAGILLISLTDTLSLPSFLLHHCWFTTPLFTLSQWQHTLLLERRYENNLDVSR